MLGLLQSRCAAEAVRRQTPEDIAALDTLLASLESAVTGNRLTDYYRAVDGFHERLQAMAANPWLTRSITDLGRFLQMVRTLMPLPENRLRQSMAEYRTLMKAIHRGDADAAEQIVYLQAMAQQRAWRMLQQQAQEVRTPRPPSRRAPRPPTLPPRPKRRVPPSRQLQPTQARKATHLRLPTRKRAPTPARMRLRHARPSPPCSRPATRWPRWTPDRALKAPGLRKEGLRWHMAQRHTTGMRCAPPLPSHHCLGRVEHARHASPLTSRGAF